jgi:predicted ATPase/Tfp pilus assembly protein PilF
VFVFVANRGGALPYAVLDDLLGIENYRRIAGCPDIETLAAYAEERLPFETAMRIGAHAARCPLCGPDLGDLREIVQIYDPEIVAAMSGWKTPFIGRQTDRETLGTALASERSRLLTVAAPSGAGKTRFALEAAVEHTSLFPDGVRYIGLAGHTRAVSAALEIARAAHMELNLRDAPEVQLRDHFAARRMLLVLDDLTPNSEAAAMIGILAERCPNLHCLSTAGSALGLNGEQVLTLPPLEMPETGRATEMLPARESVQLFTERVHAAAPDYVFAESDLRSAAVICRRAAGMPLAIELAAARVGERTVSEIAHELEANPAAETPVASLGALVEWAFDRLSRREQRLLAQCSVFVEGFFGEQAAAVCDEAAASDLLADLSIKALVQRGEALGRPRYRLLESVRANAARHLGSDREQYERRHSAYFLSYAQERAEWLESKRYREATEEFRLDLPNLRAGMDRGEARGEWRLTGEYEAALRLFLYLNGLWPEGAARAKRATEAFAKASNEPERERAQIHLAMLYARRDSYTEAEKLLHEIAQQATQRGDRATLAATRYGQGYIAQWQDRYDESAAHFQAARRYFEESGELRRAGDALTHLGKIAWRKGELATAETLLTEALTLHRRCDSRYSLSSTLSVLANVLLEQGRRTEARPLFDECLEIRRDIGDAHGEAATICNLGSLALAERKFAQAEYCFAEAWRRLVEMNARTGQGAVLCCQGCLALEQGDLALARQRFESSIEIHRELHNAIDTAEAEGHLARVAQLEGDRAAAQRLYFSSVTQLNALGAVRKAPEFLWSLSLLLAEEGALLPAALLLRAALVGYAERRGLESKTVTEDLRRIESRLAADGVARIEEWLVSRPLEEIVVEALAASQRDPI